MLQLKVASGKFVSLSKSIIKVGVSPFGLTMTPNISLIIINRFSIFYGGDQAVAVYACIAYIICIVYLIFQGVGDGSQPIISRYYGEKSLVRLEENTKTGIWMRNPPGGCQLPYSVRNKRPDRSPVRLVS